jgi:hypothetical protein
MRLWVNRIDEGYEPSAATRASAQQPAGQNRSCQARLEFKTKPGQEVVSSRDVGRLWSRLFIAQKASERY